MPRFLVILLLALGALPLNLAQARILTAGNIAPKVSVYENSSLEKNFIVIGKVVIERPLQNQLIEAMQKAANNYKGDAVLLYKVVDFGSQPGIVLGSGSGDEDFENIKIGSNVQIGSGKNAVAEGVIVKFADGGIKEITVSTSIPILR